MPIKTDLDEEIYELLLDGANEVAEKYYPKGKSPDRGQFLAAQALLHANLAPRIKNLLAIHGITQKETE